MGWSFHSGAWNHRGSEGVRACAEKGVRRKRGAWGVRGVCVGWHARAVQGVVRCEGSCGARGRVSAAAAHLARHGLLLRPELVLCSHVEAQLREGRLVKVGIWVTGLRG